MTKFQIVVDCDTEHGAFYFMDARSLTHQILQHMLEEIRTVVINESHAMKPVHVTSVSLVKTITEFTI